MLPDTGAMFNHLRIVQRATALSARAHAVHVPSVPSVWRRRVTARLRGDGRRWLRDAAFVLVAAVVLVPFVAGDVIASGLRDALRWGVLPAFLVLAVGLLIADLAAAVREVNAAAAEREQLRAAARRSNARALYNLRIRRYVREHPGLTTDDRMRVGLWNETTHSVDPVPLPAELEELWRAGEWDAGREAARARAERPRS